MTHNTNNKPMSNILYHKGDIVKDLRSFIVSPTSQGYDLLIPQCFSSNIKHLNKLTQNLCTYFPELSTNLELFLIDKKNYGYTQFIECQNRKNKNLNRIIFANMVCVRSTKSKRKIDYILLARCMSQVATYLKNQKNNENDQIHIFGAKFGTGFLGGNWSFIEQLMQDSWDGFSATIYNYDHETATTY
jgi:hypothetical protein